MNNIISSNVWSEAKQEINENARHKNDIIPIENGGTGADNTSDALNNLGAVIITTNSYVGNGNIINSVFSHLGYIPKKIEIYNEYGSYWFTFIGCCSYGICRWSNGFEKVNVSKTSDGIQFETENAKYCMNENNNIYYYIIYK